MKEKQPKPKETADFVYEEEPRKPTEIEEPTLSREEIIEKAITKGEGMKEKHVYKTQAIESLRYYWNAFLDIKIDTTIRKILKGLLVIILLILYFIIMEWIFPYIPR